MGSKQSAPQAPNAAALGRNQYTMNTRAQQQSARLNAQDQFAPWGSTTYIRDGQGNPVGQAIQLAPQELDFYNTTADTRNTLADRAQEMAGHIPTQPIDLNSFSYDPSKTQVSNLMTAEALAGLPAFGEVSNQLNPGALPNVMGASQVIDPSKLSGVDRASYVVDDSGYAPMVGAEDLEGTRREVGNAVYERMMGQQRRDFDQRREQMNTTLFSRGIPIGGEIDTNERNRYDQMVNEAQQNASMDATIYGGQEMQRLQGMALANRNQAMNEQIAKASDQSRVISLQDVARRLGLSEQQAVAADQSRVIGHQDIARRLGLSEQQALAAEQSRVADLIAAQRQQMFGETQAQSAEQSRVAALQQAMRQQQINEELMRRQQPMNEIAAMMGSTPQLPTPSFMAAPQGNIQPPDLMGAAYNSYNAANQRHQQQQSNLWGGISTLGSAALGAFGGPIGAAAGGLFGAARAPGGLF